MHYIFCISVPRCISVVTSESGKNGTFTSPNFPNAYPKMHCRFDFIGKPRERVQIVFKDFNLYHPDGAYSHGLSSNNKGQSMSQSQREREEERRKEKEKE
jgi:hypothetical protein